MDRCSFFFNDTATTEIYTLSLHDALPICSASRRSAIGGARPSRFSPSCRQAALPKIGSALLLLLPLLGAVALFAQDRKSTRLNSSHANISYAVFCLKKNNTTSLPTSFYFT